MSWSFADAPNVAVIVDRRIIDSGGWIAFVSHDADDGGWQFHTEQGADESHAAVVSLSNVVRLDASVEQLKDLPLGWRATRRSPASEWLRARSEA